MELINDSLRKRARELESQLNKSGIYDAPAWRSLIADFEQAGRVAGAAELRERAAHFERIAATEIAYL